MSDKIEKYIILHLPPTEENSSYLQMTFLFAENITELPRTFSGMRYTDFKRKSLAIKEKAVQFNVKDFIYLAKLIDFISKSLLNDQRPKIESAMRENYRDFDFSLYAKWYLGRSSAFFKSFKESCRDEAVTERLRQELDWLYR